MEFIQNVSVFEEYTSFGEKKRIPDLNKKLHPCGEAKGSNNGGKQIKY